MKRFSLFVTAVFLLGSSAQANWRWDKDAYESAKSPMVEQRVTSPSYCFDSGWEFSGYLSGFWPEDSRLTNAIGGGAALGYFFGHNFGLEGSYTVHGSGVAEQVGKFNAVWRFPLGGECCSSLAPYVFGGIGVVSSGQSEFLWNVGGGLDYRLEAWGCLGLFADFSYNFAEASIPDFTMVRAGFRLPF